MHYLPPSVGCVRFLVTLGWATPLLLLPGCAVVRTDTKGVTHIWGLGYVRIETRPTSGPPDVRVTSVSSVGGSVGLGPEDWHLSVGYRQRQQLVVYHPDQPLRLSGSATDLTQVDVTVPTVSAPSPAAPAPGAASEPSQKP